MYVVDIEYSFIEGRLIYYLTFTKGGGHGGGRSDCGPMNLGRCGGAISDKGGLVISF